jgi:hypothetical protein
MMCGVSGMDKVRNKEATKPKSWTNYGKTEKESFELVWTCDDERRKSRD